MIGLNSSTQAVTIDSSLRNPNRLDHDDLLAGLNQLEEATRDIAEAFASLRGYEGDRYEEYVAAELLDAACDGILNRAVESDREWEAQEALEARYERCR